jgi:tripartite-type tricarboxylate transporter receptor subunit TctC
MNLSGWKGAAVLATMLCGMPGQAAATENFAGKTLRIIVGTGPAGAGYAIYGQLVAQHMGKFIPGEPNLIVSFMPGASGLTAMNHLYNVAPADGSTLAIAFQDLATQQALANPAVRYDARKFTYIGRITSNVPVHMTWHSSGVRSLDDVRRRETFTGSSSANGTQADLPRAANALLGTKWKIIPGYGDVNERLLAMERGELHASIAAATLFNEQLRQPYADGKLVALLQYSETRHSLLPNVPTILDLLETDDQRSVFRFIISDIGRSVIAPPGLPSSIAEQFRTSLAMMLIDPEFIADAKRRGADIDPMSGSELAEYVGRIVDTPAETLRRVGEVIAPAR